jgi:hypothetical protein
MDPDYTEYYYGQQEEDLDWLSYWGGLTVRYGSAADWNNLYNYITSNSMAVQANYDQAATRIDVMSVIDYMIINTWSVNSDWVNWNSMWWRGNGTPNVKWRYVNWDMDNTFNLGQNYSGWPQPGGTTFNADPCGLAQNPNFINTGPNMGHFDIFNSLMDNPGFKSMFVNKYSQLTQSYFSCNYALAFLDSMIANIAPEMPGQIARWGGNIATWQNNVQLMKDQITGRCSVITQGIIDCYGVVGPYGIMVDVAPALSGKVQWDNNLMQTYPNTNIALTKDLLEACQYCADLANAQEIRQILASQEYVSTDIEYIQLENPNNATCDLNHPMREYAHHKFYSESAINRPSRTEQIWIMTQLARWGDTPFPRNWVEIVERVCRVRVFSTAARELGLDISYTRQPIQLFEGKPFNADDPIAYLNDLEIKRDFSIAEVILDAPRRTAA